MEEDYSDLDVNQIVEVFYAAEAGGRTRSAIKQETMRICLAALSAIVKNLKDIVEKNHEPVRAIHTENQD